MNKLARYLRKDAEKVWKKLGSLTRHPSYQNAICDSAGTCYSTAYWIRKKLEPHHKVELIRSTDRKYPHHAWVRIDGVDVDITGDQFGFPAVQVGKMPYKGVIRSWSEKPARHVKSMFEANSGTPDAQVVILHSKWQDLSKRIEQAYEYGDYEAAENLETEAAHVQEEMESREAAYRESGTDEVREEHSVGIDAELVRMYRDRPSYLSDEDFAEGVRHTLIDYGVPYERSKELSDIEALDLAKEASESRQQIVEKYRSKSKALQDLSKWLDQAKRRKKLHKNSADRITASWALVYFAPKLLERLGLPDKDWELVQRIIGVGEYAVVYAVDDRRVLKVTTDMDDAASAEAVRRHGRTRGLVEIFEVGRIHRKDEEDLFVIVAERVGIYPKDVSKEVDLAAYIAKLGIYEVELKDFDDNYIFRAIAKLLKIESGLLLDGLPEIALREWARSKGFDFPSPELVRKFAQDLKVASDTAWNLGFTINNDLHMGNIGYRKDEQGNLEAVVIDYGYESWRRGDKPEVSIVANPKLASNGLTIDQTLRELKQSPGLLKRLNIELKDLKHNLIGEGAYAIVFQIPGNRVLKHTWDMHDAAVAAAVKGRDLRGVVKIEEVFESPIKGYFIIAEKLKVMPSTDARKITNQDQLLATLMLAVEAEWEWEDQEWLTYTELEFPIADMRLAQQLKQDLKVGLENLRALGANVRDIHVWNVGLRQRKERWELAILDFGHLSWRGTKPQLEIARNPNISKVQKAFDKWFDRVEQKFPDFGLLELHSDVKAHDGGRHFAYCKDGDPLAIAFAPEAEDLPETNVLGLMAHEFGHAIDFRYGKDELQKQLGKLPQDIEKRADAIANAIFNITIKYDQNLVQCISCKGVPRPKGLR